MLRTRIACLLLLSFFLLLSGTARDARVLLKLDTTEADAILAILRGRADNREPSEADWQRLFSSKPYRTLRQREEGFHAPFKDDEFRQFVLSPGLSGEMKALEKTLADWSRADLNGSAERVLAYLPAASVIRAEVYVVIKPHKNSFVFHGESGPIIFLNLDPAESSAEFQNTVSHELHHIGLASVEEEYEKGISALPEGARKAARWMGAFGEGFAMLAAAGGPDVHPHATSKPEDRERWDRDMARFNSDLRTVDQFLLDVALGKLTGEAVQERAYSFFGTQGPWYTVGYKMALIVEKNYGRDELIRCMEDPRRLLALYNIAAAKRNQAPGEHLELWSPELLKAVGAPEV